MCDTGDKGFIQKGELKRHQRVHTGDKPYVCDTCDKGFIQKADMRRRHVTTLVRNPMYVIDELKASHRNTTSKISSVFTVEINLTSMLYQATKMYVFHYNFPATYQPILCIKYI